MVQLVKCLSQKHEELSLDPLHLCEITDPAVTACYGSTGGSWAHMDRQIPRAHRPTNLAKFISSRFNERLGLKTQSVNQ